MSGGRTAFGGGRIFDGRSLLNDHMLELHDGVVASLSRSEPRGCDAYVDLEGDVLSPGFVDIQVNGGDGVMFNDGLDVETVSRMAKAHRRLGATTILPTLITDTAAATKAAIAAVRDAVEQGVPGIGGLHLEGPHLSVARKGAHDGRLVRTMTDADLTVLAEAAQSLPALLVTVAPENVSLDQIERLNAAGAVVSLGHTDADFDTCMAYAGAGVRCATHLFNAMSQMGNRAPGLVGAALHSGALSAGLIADGIHVHPTMMRIAWAAKNGPGALFLVSDAMACAGTDMVNFELGGRTIRRKNGRLTLTDGTLAGADLDLPTAVRNLIEMAGAEPAEALAAATDRPARIAALPGHIGRLRVGSKADLIRLGSNFELREVLSA